QELAKTACLFDLAKHRLGQLLAQPVGARMPTGLDLGAHRLDARRSAGRLGWGRRRAGRALNRTGDGIPGAAGRHLAIDIALLQRLEIGLRAVASFRRSLLRLTAEIG